MAIYNTINSIETNLKNTYNALQNKGANIPASKNLSNLANTVNSIPLGVNTYNALPDKPQIEGITLEGNKSLDAFGIEKIINKVTSISSSSTNEQYPSAKSVYDYIENLDIEEVDF